MTVKQRSLLSLLVTLLTLAFAARGANVVRSRVDAVKPLLDRFRDQIPAELKDTNQKTWTEWSRTEDLGIRERLEQGALDSMVNLLLFGTSFTAQPRIEFEKIAQATRDGIVRARLDDLLRGLRAPNENERLVMVRDLLQRQRIDPNTPAAGVFILQNLERVLKERLVLVPRATKERPTDSATFRDRGVSLDTTISPSFGVEEALRSMKSAAAIRDASVTRIAVIGPGLDLIDKNSGYDYYPLQTLQPFALYDSLLRLGLAQSGGIEVTVLDISPQVLDHLRRARDRARDRTKTGYTVQLPQDPDAKWTPEFVRYWRAFGDRIGSDVPPIALPPALKGLETRAVRIRPEVVLACDPVNLNIVVERLDLPAAQRFDLIVATNVLVYYDHLEQALALQNIAAMLRTGGFLLTNDEVPEWTGSPVQSAGRAAVPYVEGSLGDNFVWYRKR